MNPVLQGTVVLVAAIIQDILWAKYTINAAKSQPLMAATWGGLIPVAGAIAVLAYVESAWYLAPYVVGSFIGTYYAVAYERRKV